MCCYVPSLISGGYLHWCRPLSRDGVAPSRQLVGKSGSPCAVVLFDQFPGAGNTAIADDSVSPHLQPRSLLRLAVSSSGRGASLSVATFRSRNATGACTPAMITRVHESRLSY